MRGPTLKNTGKRADNSFGTSKLWRRSQSVSISVASQITGVEIHTLRYWEREFAGFLNPIRTDGGQRRYRPEDIQGVFLLKRLLRDEMFSIAGARRHLARLQREAA
jgi:DNA-binding transcriptional MerR regulator